MGKLTASMVVDLEDRTGRKVQTIIGNLDRLKRAERNAHLADQGMRLSTREAMQERLMIEQGRVAEERRARVQAWMARGTAVAAVAGYAAAKSVREFASVDRQMTRLGNTADASAEQMQQAFITIQAQASRLALPFEKSVAAFDAMIASGLGVQESLDFLPAVLATAQATGAATEDVANTALKASSALKI